MENDVVSTDPHTDSREIRVFISSTFRDMMQERDLLVKQVFPKLRHLCAKRFVTFTEVDLRWGITEEQAAEGKVLPLCLAEIQRCRPYFIGLLGERYGWVPDTIAAEVIEDEPWLREHLQARISVTELEILHGVLNDPAMADHSFFYFRDPKWIDTLSEADRQEMIERDIPLDVERHGAQEASRRTQERKDRLTALKIRVRESGLPVVENYADPETLAQIIQEQFEELIDRLYPEDVVPDALDRERLAHEAHAKRKLFACIDRPVHQTVLNSFADSKNGGQGLVVTGSSGGGKTALLAAWARDRAKTHPDDFLFQHYFGSTPESASVNGFLRRLLGDLKRRYEIAEEIPAEPDKLREALPLWLPQTVGQGQLVLVFDGLNQIQGNDPDRRLTWLPRFFQPHVTVLASSLPGPALNALRERGWREHHLSLAGEGEIEAMVDAYLREYRKTLDAGLQHDLVSARGSKSPLFLRTILEELRQFGSFAELPAQMAHYLSADNPRDLFCRVLRRWQEDFDADRDLVRRAFSCLWAARMGLSESEWLDLLGKEGQPLPRAFWTPLFLAMEPHLAQRSGLLAFGHDFLRQAVVSEFINEDNDKSAVHLELADYFVAQQEMTARKAEEWPWQLLEAKEWDRLQGALTDLGLFLALYKDQADVELGGYWVHLSEARPDIEMGGLYLAAFSSWEAEIQKSSGDEILANNLGFFCFQHACYSEAEPLMRRALEIKETSYGSDHPEVAINLNNLAQLLKATNRLGEAEPLMRRALEIDETSFGPDHPKVAKNLNNLALLMEATNRLDEAEPMYRRALEINETFFGPDHPSVAKNLNNLALLLKATNRLDEAEPMYRRALEINEMSCGADHPEVAIGLNNLALLLQATNRFEEAEPMIRRALKISETSYGSGHPEVATYLNNLAQLMEVTNRLDEAEPLMRRSFEIDEATYGSDHPMVARDLNSLALLMEATNRLDEAEPMYRRALEINETSYGADHPEVAKNLNNLALLLKATNRLDEAEPMYRRALEINETSYGADHPEVAKNLNNLALLLKATNRLDEAEPMYRRALEINETSFGTDHPNVAIGLNNLALLMDATNRLDEAEPMYRRALEINETSYGADHPEVAKNLNNLALLLKANNRLDEAEPLMRRTLEILLTFTRTTGHAHPNLQVMMSNYRELLLKMGWDRDVIVAHLRSFAPEMNDVDNTT